MRNILVHDYGAVDVGIVWDTATSHLSHLLAVVRQLLPLEDSSSTSTPPQA